MLRGDAKTLKFNQKTMIDKKKALKFVRGRKKELKLDVTIKEVDANLDNHHEEYTECKSTLQRYQAMHLFLSRNWILN